MIPISRHQFDPRLLFEGLQDGIYFEEEEIEEIEE
jgi:hypothetical protein